jgi:hypothetical protein
MGYYSDCYDQEAKKHRKDREVLLKTALLDLIEYRQYNAKGKTISWTFRDIELEKEYDKFLNKLKAKLYDLGDN